MAIGFASRAPFKGGRLVTWTAIPNGQAGIGWSTGSFQSYTVQMSGTLGAGGSMNIEGSMDNVSWSLCHVAGGTTAILTALGEVAIVESPAFIRPNVTAGDGTTSLTANLLAVSNVG